MDIYSKRSKIYFNSLLLYIICVPLGAMNIGSIGSLLKLVAIFPIVFSIRRLRYIRVNKPLALYFFYCVLALCSCIWSINSSMSLSRSITYFELFLVMLSTCSYDFEEDDVQKIKQALHWSSRITVVLVLLFGGLYEGRLTLTGIIQEDPNMLCMYFSFGIVYTITMSISNNIIHKKLLYLLEFFAYAYTVFATGSRGGLLAIIACIACTILFQTDSFGGRHFGRKAVLIVSIAAIVYIVLGRMNDNILARYSVELVLETGGTGRTLIWEKGLEMIGNSGEFRKFFGFGAGCVIRALSAYGFSKAATMHNTFLENLMEYGIIGLVFYISMIVSFIKTSFSQNDKFSFCVLCGFIVLSLSTSLNAFKPYINIFILIIIQSSIVRRTTNIAN